jgi:hypothetical protein
MVLSLAALLAACEPTEEATVREQFAAEESAAQYKDEIISEYRVELLSCAEHRAQSLYYGGQEYFAVTFTDLEDCAY